MKKKNFNGLSLNKKTVSDLNANSVNGGIFTATFNVCTAPVSANGGLTCNRYRTCVTGGGTVRATCVNGCTVDSVQLSNFGLTQCTSIQACA